MKAKTFLLLYIIRQKSTGKMLPEIYQKKGYTHTEPESPTFATPRLFTTRAGASRALSQWIKGKQSAFYDEIGGNVIHKLETVPERDPRDMEIVEARLELP